MKLGSIFFGMKNEKLFAVWHKGGYEAKVIKFVGWVNRRIEDAGGNIMERGGKGVARRYTVKRTEDE